MALKTKIKGDNEGEKMKALKMTAVFFCFLFSVICLQAATIYVDDSNIVGPHNGSQANPYQYIQDGIDATMAGDTVLVLDGLYVGNHNKNLDFYGKDITVASQTGPETTIIDCQGNGRGFYFQNGETNLATVRDLTIRNGKVTALWPDNNGGGIRCENGSSPTIADNIIVNNFANSDGGGIYCGRYCSPIIRNNIIADNQASNQGGGICLFGYNGSPTIINNTFRNNWAKSRGGGIHCGTNFSSLFANNIFIGNSSTNAWSNGCGGGISFLECTPVVFNNTLVGNWADQGDGLSSEFGASPKIVNSIAWGSNSQIYIDQHTSSMSITASDVQGGYTGAGNINQNPMFVDPTNGNYGLQADSPCIGLGVVRSGLPTDDFNGRPRINPANSWPDMGAQESAFASPVNTLIIYSLGSLDLLITTPNSQIISKTNPGPANYQELDLDGDGLFDDRAIIANPGQSAWQVSATNDTNGPATQFGSIGAMLGTTALLLVSQEPTNEIVSENYGFSQDDGQITPHILVEIDIKPGTYPNSANLSSNGVIPVAIFSSDIFKATQADPSSILLAGATVKSNKKGEYQASTEDVNHDGLPDLLIHISTDEIKANELVGEMACLTGQTCQGLQFKGYDTIRIVPKNKGPAVEGSLAFALGQNFSNPFNPETWIPYKLAKTVNVAISIYATDGKLVKILALGQQTAGDYSSKTKAAYWDGRNQDGEPVSSGIYFYVLKAGDFIASKKMLLLK